MRRSITIAKKSISSSIVARSLSVASAGGASPSPNRKQPRASEPVPTSEFPLQNEGSKDSPPATGYNLVLQRMANIVLNVTDKQQPIKLLHVFPENAFLLYMGKVKYSI